MFALFGLADRIDLPHHYNNLVNPILFSLQETLRIMHTVWYEKFEKVLEGLLVFSRSHYATKDNAEGSAFWIL